MQMFKKLVAIEPVGLIPSAEKQLKRFAAEVIMYDDLPSGAEEIAARIGDADGVLLSYTTYLGQEALGKCAHVKYIGMCCSLYSPESANVAIPYAHKRGITVSGIRDYGDEGVVEYVLSELVRCLHGFGQKGDGSPEAPWYETPREITGLKVGIIGLGKLGGMIADALNFLGADISYFSRSEKQTAKTKGYQFTPLNNLLSTSEVVISCLNKNTILLHEGEFQHLGNKKILFNVGLSPAWDATPFNQWINQDNRLYCDSNGALGNNDLLNHPNIYCMGVSSGRTSQAFVRLSEKVLDNIAHYLKTQ
jgi:phosphoglycerate dehydrogenase-like enzyme